MEMVCEWERGQSSRGFWGVWGTGVPPLPAALCTPGLGSRRRVLPGSSSWLCGSVTGATPCPSPLGWGQCRWSLARCGWRGSKPAPGTDGDDSALMEGSPGATGAGVLPLGVGGSYREDGSGVTWLWGCTPGSLPFVLGLAPGSRGARPQDPGLSSGWLVRAPLGLSSVTYPILALYGDFSSSRESPMLPGELPWAGSRGAGRARSAHGTRRARGSCGLHHLRAPLCFSSWTSHPVPTGATPPGSPLV